MAVRYTLRLVRVSNGTIAEVYECDFWRAYTKCGKLKKGPQDLIDRALFYSEEVKFSTFWQE